MKFFALALAAGVALASALPAAAQSVNQREHRQEQRIHQGMSSGALTPSEARRLQRRETRLQEPKPACAGAAAGISLAVSERGSGGWKTAVAGRSIGSGTIVAATEWTPL